MAYFGENWDDNEFPAAYLITIATYGTWLHGGKQFSVDTHNDFNRFGAARRSKNDNLATKMRARMSAQPRRFSIQERKIVYAAIQEVCRHRGYKLYALNVRANHAHSVVAATVRPELIADAFKAYATRRLRIGLLLAHDAKVWSRGRSRRYLWRENHVSAAIDYVLYCQGDVIFDDWYSLKFDD